jgi:hypothetical protein
MAGMQQESRYTAGHHGAISSMPPGTGRNLSGMLFSAHKIFKAQPLYDFSQTFFLFVASGS